MILIVEGPVIFALMPPATVSILAVAGIGLMKRANRCARAQVAAGTYPFLLAGEDRRLDEGEEIVLGECLSQGNHKEG